MEQLPVDILAHHVLLPLGIELFRPSYKPKVAVLTNDFLHWLALRRVSRQFRDAIIACFERHSLFRPYVSLSYWQELRVNPRRLQFQAGPLQSIDNWGLLAVLEFDVVTRKSFGSEHINVAVRYQHGKFEPSEPSEPSETSMFTAKPLTNDTIQFETRFQWPGHITNIYLRQISIYSLELLEELQKHCKTCNRWIVHDALSRPLHLTGRLCWDCQADNSILKNQLRPISTTTSCLTLHPIVAPPKGW